MVSPATWEAESLAILARRDAPHAVALLAERLLSRHADKSPVSAVAAALREARVLAPQVSGKQAGIVPAAADADRSGYRHDAARSYDTTGADVQDAVREIMDGLFPDEIWVQGKGTQVQVRDRKFAPLKRDVLRGGQTYMMGRARNLEDALIVLHAYNAALKSVTAEFGRCTMPRQVKRNAIRFKDRLRVSRPVVSRAADGSMEIRVGSRAIDLEALISRCLAAGVTEAPTPRPAIVDGPYADAAPDAATWNFPPRADGAGQYVLSPAMLESAKEQDAWMARNTRPGAAEQARIAAEHARVEAERVAAQRAEDAAADAEFTARWLAENPADPDALLRALGLAD